MFLEAQDAQDALFFLVDEPWIWTPSSVILYPAPAVTCMQQGIPCNVPVFNCRDLSEWKRQMSLCLVETDLWPILTTTSSCQ